MMSAPMNYTDFAKAIMQQLEKMHSDVVAKLTVIEKKVDDLFEDEPSTKDDKYESDPVEEAFGGKNTFDNFIDEDEIYKKGRKVPYSRIIEPRHVRLFKDFIGYVIEHPEQFNMKEVEYATYASEKDFPDVKIADNSRRILGGAYMRTYKKPWPITFIRGHMVKYQGQFAWEWEDGSKD